MPKKVSNALTPREKNKFVQSLSPEECTAIIRLIQKKMAAQKAKADRAFKLPPFDGDFLDRPVNLFNLRPKIATRLKTAGFATVSDIVKTGAEQMEMIRNIGGVTMQEVKTKILAHYSERL